MNLMPATNPKKLGQGHAYCCTPAALLWLGTETNCCSFKSKTFLAWDRVSAVGASFAICICICNFIMTPIGSFRHALLPVNLMVFELVSFVFVWAPRSQLRLQSYQLGVCDSYLFSLQHKSKLHAVTLADRNTRLRVQILFSSLKGLNVCFCHLESLFLIQ